MQDDLGDFSSVTLQGVLLRLSWGAVATRLTLAETPSKLRELLASLTDSTALFELLDGFLEFHDLLF